MHMCNEGSARLGVGVFAEIRWESLYEKNAPKDFYGMGATYWKVSH